MSFSRLLSEEGASETLASELSEELDDTTLFAGFACFL